MSQVGNRLKKNFNNWAITSLINNTKVNEKPIVGWKIIAGKKITVEVFFPIIRKFRNEIVVRAVGTQAKSKLADLSVGAQKLNFYLPEDLVLFQSEVKKIDASGDVVITIPKMIAQVDRRKHMRLFIEEGMKVGLFFKKENYDQRVMTQSFSKNCFDLSAGGLSFIASKPEKKFFKVGDIISGMEVEIDHKKIYASGEIISIFEIEPNPDNELIYKGWKVCVKYNNISSKDRDFVNDFVFKYVVLDDAI